MRLLRKALLLLGDWSALYLSLFFLMLIRYGTGWQGQWDLHFRPFSLVFFLWILTLYASYLYEARFLRVDIASLKTMATAVLIALTISILSFYLFPPGLIYPRRNMVLFGAIFGVILICWRTAFFAIIRRWIHTRVLFIGAGAEAAELHKYFLEYPQLRYETAATLDKMPNRRGLEELVAKDKINLILYQPPANRVAHIKDLLNIMGNRTTMLMDAGVFYERVLGKVSTESLNDVWFLKNLGDISWDAHRVSKRLLDVAVGLLGTALFVVLYLLIAALIKLDSQGPAIFCQSRIGEKNKTFTLYKFRTMRALSKGGSAETGEAKWAKENDPRITRTGKWLRKIRLDELPQFMNILWGNMSLVGPRPERPEFVEELSEKIPYYNMRHLVKPGLTGWAQVNYGYGSSYQDAQIKLQYDIYYAKNRSLIFDLAIIFRTLKTVLSGAGR